MKTPIIDVEEQRVGYDNMIANAEEIPTSFSYVSWVSSYFVFWGLGGGAVGWMANANVVAAVRNVLDSWVRRWW
jgi:hypothetical protein